jgi:hypothetical protein
MGHSMWRAARVGGAVTIIVKASDVFLGVD